MAVSRKQLAFQLRDWVGSDRLRLIDPGQGWPSRFECETTSGLVRLAAHLGRITLSRRERDDVERRFQNPGQGHPVVARNGEYPILLGLADTDRTPVVVGMDGQKRIGTNTRQSLFMPKELIQTGMNRGWAEHTSTSSERIVAFVPPLLPFFIDVYRAGRSVSNEEIRAALRQAGVRPLMSLGGPFRFDVFLSFSSKDRPAARAIAERLREDGLNVWFDEWMLETGDDRATKIAEGLDSSCTLLLCMSANAVGPDWAHLEAGTFQFRNPLDEERRFIPLRLDDTPLQTSLEQFLYIDWRGGDRDREYAKLLERCRQPAKIAAARPAEPPDLTAERVVQLEDVSNVRTYAFTQDGRQVLLGTSNHRVLIADVHSGKLHKVSGKPRRRPERGREGIWHVAWGPDPTRAIFTSGDGSVRLVDLVRKKYLKELRLTDQIAVYLTWNHQDNTVLFATDRGDVFKWDLVAGLTHYLVEQGDIYRCFASIPQRGLLLGGSVNGPLRLWDAGTGECIRQLVGHTGSVWWVKCSPDGRLALSSSFDKTLRLWEIDSGRCIRILVGHSHLVRSIDWWERDPRYVLSASNDTTIRLWDIETGRCVQVLRGHRAGVVTVAWSADELRAFSGDEHGEIRTWDLSTALIHALPTKNSVSDAPPAPRQVHYTNAKVLLVGESGVGKTALSNRLAHGIEVKDDTPLPSTDGAWATHWPLKHVGKEDGIEREIWLWDFAGQVDYRLVHQLFMDNAAAAVLVFNPQNENALDGLGHWDHDLQKATRRPFAKLLAAARVDRGSLVVSSANVQSFMEARGFKAPLHETSAKTGTGCDRLRDAIIQAIDWKSIPETTSPALYLRLRREILRLREGGMVLIRLAELKQRMEMELGAESFELSQLEAVVDLLSGPGMIKRLDFGGFILLQPEVLSRYAAAVVRTVRKHPQELGCIREDDLLAGKLDYQDFARLPRDDEAVVLHTLLETFVSRAWCLRQPCDSSALLTFPSYFRRERKEQPSHPSVLVSYRFDGATDDVYATLVVRLHHTVAVQCTDLWKSAADFKTQTGQKLGITLRREAEGTSLLEVYLEPDVDLSSRLLFLRYVHDHLHEHSRKVVRLRHYFCGNHACDSYGERFGDQSIIDKALAKGGRAKVYCPHCGKPIPLRDIIEEKFESKGIKEQARALEANAQTAIDNESRELILVGHALTTVGEAGQIFRSHTNDHGIDGEIEFKDDRGQACGRRLYLQLKSGDSYLRKRSRDGAEVFQIKKRRWVTYWQQQAYPVMLVIRTSDGVIRWMDVSDYLRRKGEGTRQIVFEGEQFDAMSVRQWRTRSLS